MSQINPMQKVGITIVAITAVLSLCLAGSAFGQKADRPPFKNKLPKSGLAPQHQTMTSTRRAMSGFSPCSSGTVLVWEGVLGGQDFSGAYIGGYLSDAGYDVDYTSTFPSSLLPYDAVFLSFGNYGGDYTVFDQTMAVEVTRYLQNGGKLYLEGGDALGCDQVSSQTLLELFGLAWAEDGNTNVIDGLQGQADALTNGMLFTSSTQVNSEYIDMFHADAGIPAFVESDYGIVGVQNIGPDGHRTFCFSYALANLDDATPPSTKADLMAAIVDFLQIGVSISPQVGLSASSLSFDVQSNETGSQSVRISNSGAGTLTWSIGEALPQNPLAKEASRGGKVQAKAVQQKGSMKSAWKMPVSRGKVSEALGGGCRERNLRAGVRRSPNAAGSVIRTIPAPAYILGLTMLDGSLWTVVGGSPEYLVELDPLDGSELSAFSIGDDFHLGITNDGTNLWVCNFTAGTIEQYTRSGTQVSSWTAPNLTTVRGIAWDGSAFWLSGSNGQSLYRVAPDGTPLDTLSLPYTLIGWAMDMEWVPQHSEGHLWINDFTNSSMVQLNTETNPPAIVQVIPEPDPGNYIEGVAHDGTNLWISDFTSPLIYVVDDGIVEDNCSWLSESPASGLVPVGGNQDVDVVACAVGLAPGTYDWTLLLASNDRLNPQMSIPVHLTVETPLPIQLAHFTAVPAGPSEVQLSWTTLSELNNYGFEIQRKEEGQPAYISLPGSFIPGHGTTNEPQNYSYRDSEVHPGSWYYRLKQIDLDGSAHYSEGIRVTVLSGVDIGGNIPAVYSLAQSYPNPSNPSATIRYGLPYASRVAVAVFNTLGQRVVQLVNAQQEAGYHEAVFRGDALTTGVYFYRIDATSLSDPGKSFSEVKKMLLVK